MTTRKFALTLAVLQIVFGSGPAWANSMPISFGIGTAFLDRVAFFLGCYGVVVSIALGLGGLVVVKKVQLDSSRRVFARGFLGVAAVVCFGCSVGLIGAGSSGEKSPLVASLANLIPLVLGVEFAIAGALYMAVHQKKGTAGSLALAITSYAIAVISALATVGLLAQQLKLGSAVVPSIIVAGTAAPIAASVRAYRRAVPETVADVLKWGLWGWAAFLLLLVGGAWGGSADGTDERLENVFMTVSLGLGPLVLAVQAGLSTWLLRRRWRAQKDKLALALAVPIAIGGAVLALWSLVAFFMPGGGAGK